MAKFKATSNVVFIVDGKEQSYDKDVEYDMDVKTAEELNANAIPSRIVFISFVFYCINFLSSVILATFPSIYTNVITRVCPFCCVR